MSHTQQILAALRTTLAIAELVREGAIVRGNGGLVTLGAEHIAQLQGAIARLEDGEIFRQQLTGRR